MAFFDFITSKALRKEGFEDLSDCLTLFGRSFRAGAWFPFLLEGFAPFHTFCITPFLGEWDCGSWGSSKVSVLGFVPMPGRCFPASAANLRAGEDSNAFHHGCTFVGDSRLVTPARMLLFVLVGDLLRVGDLCALFEDGSPAMPSLESWASWGVLGLDTSNMSPLLYCELNPRLENTPCPSADGAPIRWAFSLRMSPSWLLLGWLTATWAEVPGRKCKRGCSSRPGW